MNDDSILALDHKQYFKIKTMATVTLKGTQLHTNGSLPEVGICAPDFSGVKSDLSEVHLSDFKGKNVVLNIFPSLDTAVCAASVRRFNKEASSLKDTTVLCISKDLPFAQGRFCTVEGLNNVVTISVFRDTTFEHKFGMLLKDGPLAGLLARGVVIVNKEGKVIYTELVPEITHEPDYQSAMNALQ